MIYQLIIKYFFYTGTYIHTVYSGDLSLCDSVSDTIATSLPWSSRLHAFLYLCGKCGKAKRKSLSAGRAQG